MSYPKLRAKFDVIRQITGIVFFIAYNLSMFFYLCHISAFFWLLDGVIFSYFSNRRNTTWFSCLLAFSWPRCYIRPSGRPYVLLQMFFLYSPGNLRAPSADRRETLPHDRNMGVLYNVSPKIRGPSPQRNGAKNMQNSARFHTTSKFDREYLRNGSRYPKSENVWSTNYRELEVSLDLPKLHFSGDYISALRGCWPLKF